MSEIVVKKDIRLMDLNQIIDSVEAMGEKKFRGKQIYEWLWNKSATSFEMMSNLPKDFRETLAEHFEIRAIQLDVRQNSKDGTIKCRYKLYDGNLIEAVLIPVLNDNRFTVCVSSQVGCSLSCSFCATGKMGRIRNLDPGEIYDQVAMVNQICESEYHTKLTNIVFMGMGEPLLSYKNVNTAIDQICSEDGLGFSYKRVTVSTAGISKMIVKLAEDKVKYNLALSLHAADDVKRNEIMAINNTNDISSLMDALTYFHETTKNKISYEYILLEGFNDSEADANKLAKLCRSFPVRVNIINYNPIQDAIFDRSSESTTDRFAQILRDKGVMITVRKSRGQDIDAACGQLANK